MDKAFESSAFSAVPPPPAIAAAEVNLTLSDAAKLYKATRPWYKKKRYVLPLGLFVFSGFVGAVAESESGAPSSVAFVPTTEATTSAPLETDGPTTAASAVATTAGATTVLPPTTTSETELQGARSNPFPFDTPAEFQWDVFGDADESSWNIEVSEIRDATAEVLAAHDWNDPPPEGLMFAAADVRGTLVQSSKEPLSFGWNVEFEMISDTNVYDLGYYSDLDARDCGFSFPGEFDDGAEVFAGGTIAGTVCLVVPADSFEQLAFVLNIGSDRWYYRG